MNEPFTKTDLVVLPNIKSIVSNFCRCKNLDLVLVLSFSLFFWFFSAFLFGFFLLNVFFTLYTIPRKGFTPKGYRERFYPEGVQGKVLPRRGTGKGFTPKGYRDYRVGFFPRTRIIGSGLFRIQYFTPIPRRGTLYYPEGILPRRGTLYYPYTQYPFGV